METILVAVVIALSTLLASSMIYILLWNLCRVYLTKYMSMYFEHSKEMCKYQAETFARVVRETMKGIENIYRLENNLPVKEETVKEEEESK